MTRPTPETLAHSARRARAAAEPAGDADPAATPRGRRRPPRPYGRRPVPVSGAGSLVRSLEALGVDVVVRHPRRGDPAGVRPALRLDGAAHPGPARAGRRARRDRLRAGHRQGRRLHRHLRPGRDEPGHPDRRRVHGLGADRRDHRPGGPARRSARTPSRRRTSRASRCRSPSTTSWCRPPRRSRGSWPRRSTWPRTGRPGPVLVDIPKDVLQAPTTLLLAAHAGPARLPADPAPARQADPRGGPADAPAARRPVLYVGGGVLKAGATDGAAPAGRADRHPGGHHADGAAARSPTRTRSTWACPACTAPSPRSTRCRRPT